MEQRGSRRDSTVRRYLGTCVGCLHERLTNGASAHLIINPTHVDGALTAYTRAHTLVASQSARQRAATRVKQRAAAKRDIRALEEARAEVTKQPLRLAEVSMWFSTYVWRGSSASHSCISHLHASNRVQTTLLKHRSDRMFDGRACCAPPTPFVF